MRAASHLPQIDPGAGDGNPMNDDPWVRSQVSLQALIE
jgi:hypothetical protein